MKTTVFIILLQILSLKCYAPIDITKAAYKYRVVEVNVEVLDLELERFLNHLGKKESGNAWNVVNHLNMMGKFQISPIALKDIKYTGTYEEFLNDSILQKECAVKILKKNKKYLKEYLKYVDKEVNGTKITLSGLLAGAWLGGHRSVKRFINENYNAIDSNSMTVVNYIKEFNGYNFKI